MSLIQVFAVGVRLRSSSALVGIAAVLLAAACGSGKQTNRPPTASATAPARTQTASATAQAGRASPTPPVRTPEPTVVSRPGVPGQIVIGANGATPSSITIQAGRQVTWVNNSSATHHVVSDEVGLFDTGEIPPGQSAGVALSAAGAHAWHDAADPSVRGTITVLP